MAHSDIRELIGTVPIPLILVGADERVREANRAAEDLVGPGAVGRHYITALRQPDLLDAIEATLGSGTSRSTRYITSRHGRDAELEVRLAPIRLDGATGILLSFVDNAQLEEAGQMRRDFVANVSHELRTPLTAMSGLIETLLGPARDDPDARERFLKTMAREANRMNRLVEDLLSLSGVEAEERVRPTQLVNIADFVHRALDQLKDLAQQQGIQVQTDFEDQAMTAPGDPDQLMQVVINLTENAMKYGAAGGFIRLEVSRSDYEPALRSEAVRIDVIDYGEGIDPVHVPRLTERFYRIDDHRSREMGGTGLGLAIVKHIVSRHRGRLRISSTPKEGSRFSVLLPRT